MARLAPVELDRLGFFSRLFVRFVYWATRKKVGKVLLSSQIAAHHPLLLFGRSMLESTNLASHRVDDRLKTLASLRAAMLAGCPH
jgi:hypothetical protein